MKTKILLLLFFGATINFSHAQRIKKKQKAVIATEKIAKLNRQIGFFDFSYEEATGKIFLYVDISGQIEKEFLYINSLSAGIGSNDIGLDRGQLGDERLVYFKKMGDKLMLIQPNLAYRSSSENKLEQQSIAQAFAKSVLYGFTIYKTTPTHYVLDITSFLLQDTHGVTQRLQASKQGNFKIDTQRSAIALERTKNFPKNTEFDVMLTFSGTPKGRWIRSVTPSPNSVTVHQHHSFVALPEEPFQTRRFDPRSGAIPFSYNDYSTPVNESTEKIFALRHRLEKKDPEAAVSEAVEPIIYYLDNGTPEPVRSALLEGGRWWNEAFEAIGYKNAFQVKILPDDADPMDIRYNVIQWVHRSTRGWSYGASVVDPRSGEILKGHVSLGSLRIRQDFMIAQALTNAPYAEGKVDDSPMLNLAIARIRQLSAHEIGHTLGFAHNFAASVKNRASVMDYPHPTLALLDGKIIYDNAYDTGIGDWDKVSVAYSYSDFPENVDESVKLNTILTKSIAAGHQFISDRDARPIGGAHPYAHLWDNGQSAIEEFNHLLRIRKVAMNNFSVDQLKDGEPLSILRDRLVPLYFLHRYQLEALVKLVGGQQYDYGVKGSPSQPIKTVTSKDQKEALKTLINALSDEVLAIPAHVRTIIPPAAYGYGATRESFKTQTGPTFDPLGAAHTLSDAVIGMVLHPQRASRLFQQRVYDPQQLGLSTTIQALIKSAFHTSAKDAEAKALQSIVRGNMLQHLMSLGSNPNVSSAIHAIVFKELNDLKTELSKSKSIATNAYYSNLIERYFSNPKEVKPLSIPKIPEGSPIGTTQSCSFL